MGTINNFKKYCVTYFLFIFLMFFSTVSTGLCVEEVPIGDNPMEAESKSPPAVIMFILDNSGSMDWDYMVENSSGQFTDAASTKYYLYENADFENGEDNVYDPATYPVLTGADRRYWRSRWAEHSRIYYNPAVTYEPWPAVTGYTMGNASTTKPFSNPYNNLSTDSKLDFAHTYITMSGVDVKLAHYFIKHPTTHVIYLVNFTAGVRTYYAFSGGEADLYVNDGQLSSVAQAVLPDAVKNLSDAEDLQNFANWISYYKRRELTAKAAVALTIRDLSGVQVGFYTLHSTGGVRQTALDVKVSGVDHTDALLQDLYDIDSANGTPLRLALENVGEYFKYQTSGDNDGGLGTSPYALSGGPECQFTFAIAMTDGYWNGGDPSVGNSDNTTTTNYTAAAPYMDGNSNMLADVAMEYYKIDLAPTIDNEVPTSGCDNADWQHMITYGVSFGVTGNIDPADYPPCDYKNAADLTPPWGTNKIDDLYHAAVNGRGEFVSASNPSELVNALKEVINSIHSRLGTAASVTINSQSIFTGSMYFQSVFNSETWAGNVKAKAINADGTVVTAPVWNADDYFSRSNPKFISHDHIDKRIVTYDSSLLPGSPGIEFKYDDLTSAQLVALYPDSGIPANDVIMRGNIVDVIRGKVVSGFRERNVTLGDIVHSAPMLYKPPNFVGTVFVGANDGMLHAFNASDGKERFAYIPDLVMGNYYNAADLDKSFYGPDYGLNNSHRFFIDQSVFIRQGVDSMTLLVGGLGKGGKGVYCLDITNAHTITDSSSIDDVKAMVKWEFPAAPDDDMGYSYSRPIIAKSNADIDIPADTTNQDWIAIFGNGYNSVNGNAVLFILNAKTGALVKRIDTGVGAGLSSAAVVDINRDLKADYVYVGDLDGNMWKFDLTGSTVAEWDVAYKDGIDPKPLVNIGKPITVRPDVMRHCKYNSGILMCPDPPDPDAHKPLKGYLVFFGTGKFLHSPDDFTSGTQYMFGIWDYGDDDDDSEYLGDWNSSTNTLSNLDTDIKLLEQTIAGQVDTPNFGIVKWLTDYPAEWGIVCDGDGVSQDPDPDPNPATVTHVGWFRQLHADFMVTSDPIVWGGNLIYIEMNPSDTICQCGGESWLWEVDACTGGRLDHAVFDTDGDGDIDADDISGPGIHYDEIIYPPAILSENEDDDDDDDIEFKFFPGAGGTVNVVIEPAQPKGFVYWQVLQQN